MSQAIANSIMDNLREQIAFLQAMCAVYPGDPDGELTLDCMVLEEIISDINEYDWDLSREELKKILPKVTITYDPPLTSSI
jgi:phage terminase large subunit-like protein